ncbi:MAG: metal ABC transporter substrate-binding protein [Lachnospiraceae bacterium]|nr:metal ABC transporter substrate-binding protein [Lachnospiraceae bacterium]
MKKMFLTVAAAVLMCVIILSASCGNAGNGPEDSGNIEGSGKLKIVTTLYAPYDFAVNIAGSMADVTMLLAPGEESHSYDPTPQDIINIGKCDLFIYNGGENEAWVDGVLESVGDNVKVLRMMDVVDKMYAEEPVSGMQPEDGGDGGEDNSGVVGEDNAGDAGAGNGSDTDDGIGGINGADEYDEHVWASLDNAIAIVKAVTDEIVSIDPDNEETYKAGMDRYTAELSRVRDDIAQVVNESKRKLIVFGDRFPMRYFTEEFGLEYYAAFPGCSADTEADAATIKFLIDKVREENIPIVIKNEMSNGTVADSIAEETGTEVRTMYACHNISKEDFDSGIGYVGLMERNLAVLKEALN